MTNGIDYFVPAVGDEETTIPDCFSELLREGVLLEAVISPPAFQGIVGKHLHRLNSNGATTLGITTFIATTLSIKASFTILRYTVMRVLPILQ